MSNLITLIPYDSFDFDDVLFKFDAAKMQSRDLSIQLSEDPVEDGSTISNYAVERPIIFNLSGLISAYYPGQDEQAPERLADISDALRTLWKARSLVSLSTNLWDFDVIIVKIKESESVDDGALLSVDLTLQTVVQSEARFVDLPPYLITSDKASNFFQDLYDRTAANMDSSASAGTEDPGAEYAEDFNDEFDKSSRGE